MFIHLFIYYIIKLFIILFIKLLICSFAQELRAEGARGTLRRDVAASAAAVDELRQDVIYIYIYIYIQREREREIDR